MKGKRVTSENKRGRNRKGLRTRERKTNDEFNPVQAGREEKNGRKPRVGGDVVRKK